MSVAVERITSELAYIELQLALTRYGKPPHEIDAEQRRTVTEAARVQWQMECLVIATPQACDVVVPKATLEDAVAIIRKRYETEEEFRLDLARNALDPAALEAALARQLTVEAVLEHVSSGCKVEEMDVELYYHLHPEQFVRPETRAARHILITVNEDFTENTKTAARARVQAIAERLAADPRRFSEQATKHSECPTALSGGQLGIIKRGQLYPALDGALFALDAGQISQVVESPMGFHLLCCEAIHPAAPVSYAEAAPQIREFMLLRDRRRTQKRWLATLNRRGF